MSDFKTAGKLAVSLLLSALATAPATAQDTAAPAPATTPAGNAAETLPTGLTDDGWAEATLARVQRDGDRLTVTVRFKKDASITSGSSMIYSDLSKTIWETGIYITADNKKYLLMQDANGKALASPRLQLTSSGPLAGSWSGTFPAPPAGSSATLQLLGVEPLGPFTIPQ